MTVYLVEPAKGWRANYAFIFARYKPSLKAFVSQEKAQECRREWEFIWHNFARHAVQMGNGPEGSASPLVLLDLNPRNAPRLQKEWHLAGIPGEPTMEQLAGETGWASLWERLTPENRERIWQLPLLAHRTPKLYQIMPLEIEEHSASRSLWLKRTRLAYGGYSVTGLWEPDEESFDFVELTNGLRFGVETSWGYRPTCFVFDLVEELKRYGIAPPENPHDKEAWTDWWQERTPSERVHFWEWIDPYALEFVEVELEVGR